LSQYRKTSSVAYSIALVILICAPVLAADDTGVMQSARAATPISGNLVVNGGFEVPGVDDVPEAWVLKSWQGDKLASGRVHGGGRFDRMQLQLVSTNELAIYGCHTHPIDIDAYAGQECILSLHYYTKGPIYADAVVVTFAEDFAVREWDTLPLSREELHLKPSNQWGPVSHRFQLPPQAHHAVVLIRIHGEGTFGCDGVSLRSLPAEIGCEVRSAGLIEDPRRRITQLRLTNNTTAQVTGQVRMETWEQDRRTGAQNTRLQLAAGEVHDLNLPYGYDFRRSHDLRLTVYGNRDDEIYDGRHITVPSLIDARVVMPAFRSTIIANIPEEQVVVKGRIHGTPKVVESTRLSAHITGGTETIAPDEGIIAEPNGDFTVSLLPANIVSGQYLVTLRAVVNNYTAEVQIPFDKAKPSQHAVAYDSCGRLWVGREPIFPLGMGYVLQTQDIKPIGDAGFDFLIAPSRTASWDFMDHARDAGVGVFLSSASLEANFWSNMTDKHAERPEFWGWYILEKPDTHSPSIDPSILTALHDDLVNLTPDRPVLCSLSSPMGLRKYGAAGDIPIAWSELTPPGDLSTMSKLLQQAQHEIPATKPVWALIPIAGLAHIQDASLDPAAAGRPPTPPEYRAMAYLAILCGAKGIVSYGYRLPGDVRRQDYLITRDNAPLWAEIANVNRELKTFGLAILAGRRQPHPFDPAAPVQWGVWEHDGRAIVIIVNTTGEPQTGALVVDNLSRQALQDVNASERLEGTEAGQFARQLAPYEARVYTGALHAAQ